MKTNLQVRVIYSYSYALYNKKFRISWSFAYGESKNTVIKKAKAFAKKCGVPFNDKIVRQHGC
jgi:hypothetical protein